MREYDSFGSKIVTSKYNNLNAIRLLLALAVILSHSFPVSLGSGGESKGEPLFTWTHQQESLGFTAVNLFFCVSGMLISKLAGVEVHARLPYEAGSSYLSWFHCSSGLFGSDKLEFCPISPRVGQGVSWLFLLLKDCLFLTDNSLCWKGMFSGNPLPNAANGSLWTIRIEFECYMLVAVIGLFCLFKHRVLILFATFLFFWLIAKLLCWEEDVGNLCRFLVYFLVGMSIWLWRDKTGLEIGSLSAVPSCCWAQASSNPGSLWPFPSWECIALYG